MATGPGDGRLLPRHALRVYADGYAAGMAEASDQRQGATLESIAQLRQALDAFDAAWGQRGLDLQGPVG